MVWVRITVRRGRRTLRSECRKGWSCLAAKRNKSSCRAFFKKRAWVGAVPTGKDRTYEKAYCIIICFDFRFAGRLYFVVKNGESYSVMQYDPKTETVKETAVIDNFSYDGIGVSGGYLYYRDSNDEVVVLNLAETPSHTSVADKK